MTNFYYRIGELKKYFQLHFINPILDAFTEYNTPSYKENLLNKYREILEGGDVRIQDNGDKELEIKRQESKDVEETFNQIKQLIETILNSFSACFECNNLINNANYYLGRTNIVYKNVKQWIINNKYRKNVYQFLINKLNKLYYNILRIYYSNIISGVRTFRVNMNNFINLVYRTSQTTLSTTALTLNGEYTIILDTAHEFDVKYTNNKERSAVFEYKHETEHMINKATATFTGIKEYSEFKFDTYLEGGLFKTPYVKARIVDKTRPDKLALQVRTEYGFCGRTSFRYDVDFNDANYTLTLDYNTKTNNIIINTFTDFDKYYYTSQMYQIPDKAEFECLTFFGYEVCFIKQCYDKKSRVLSKVYNNEVAEKKYNETMIIVG